MVSSPRARKALWTAVDHLGRVGVETVRDKKTRWPVSGGDAKADGHLLHGAGDGGWRCWLRPRLCCVGQRVHARVLQRGKETVKRYHQRR